jgi:hypothetical protein
MTPHEPDPLELRALQIMMRLRRLKSEGLTMDEAASRMLAPESADEYTRRNEQALAEVEARLLSPEYLERFAKIQAEPDEEVRAKLEAELKRENYATLDLEALHRVIRARNRQWKAEGILPPDAPI